MINMLKYIVFLILFTVSSNAFATTLTNQAKIRYLAAVIYAEANNEEYYGKSLVATVIWSRSDENPDNIHKTITIPKQFASPQYGEGSQWQECLQLSESMYNKTFQSRKVILGNGVVIVPDHFFHGKAPWWAVGKIWRKIGKLKFLRLDSYRKDNS